MILLDGKKLAQKILAEVIAGVLTKNNADVILKKVVGLCKKFQMR